MQIVFRVAVVLAALALCAPAVALAQSRSIAQGGSGVSTKPPVSLEDDDGESRQATRNAASGSELPNTGSDPRLPGLLGVALILLGVGLRLRTADADLY